MKRIFPILSLMSLLAGCSVSSEQDSGIVVIASYPLDTALAETSGLFCTEDGAFTLNDSGNTPELFTISETGEITGQIALGVINQDWETITGNDEWLYIGDIGNNAGKRTDLGIYKVNRNTPSETTLLSIRYAGYKPENNVPYAHDYDGEAMTLRDDKLVIFSKSWASEESHVYIAQDIKAKQVLSPVASVSGLPGVVTGADWIEDSQIFLLVGYRVNALGMIKAFIATVGPDFTVRSVAMLPQFSQVEAVCQAPDGHIWITQESSPFDDAKLAILKFR